jgi:hypothetical protein
MTQLIQQSRSVFRRVATVVVCVCLSALGISRMSWGQTLLSSITLTGWIVVTNPAPPSGSTNYVYPAGAVFVSTNGTQTAPYTNWPSAFTNWNAVSVNPGGTVVVGGGTYSLSNSSAYGYISLVGGTNGAPVTYMMAQDSSHNGAVVINGSGITPNAFMYAPFCTLNGYNSAMPSNQGLVVSNFLGDSFIIGGGTNFTLEYAAIYNAIHVLGPPVGFQMAFVTHYPPANMTDETSPAADFQAVIQFDNYSTPTNTDYLSSAFIHDCSLYAYRWETNFGYGDVIVEGSPQNMTLSNCFFGTVPIYNYSGCKHQEALQLANQGYTRVMDCTFRDLSYCGVFDQPTGGWSGGNLQFFNNVFEYTDSNYTNGCCSIPITFDVSGNTGGVVSNVLIANNTMAGGNNGITCNGAAAQWTNCVCVNNLLVNNQGINLNVSGGNSNNWASLYNKIEGWTSCTNGGYAGYPYGAETVPGQFGNAAVLCAAVAMIPANLAGPATANAVTFASYSAWSTNNNLAPASNDTGAIGNGTNWPASIFTADIVGNPRTNFNGRWTLGAYQY